MLSLFVLYFLLLQLCFSNEFSSFTHKIVYFSWETPEDAAKADAAETVAPLTQSAVAVIVRLYSIYGKLRLYMYSKYSLRVTSVTAERRTKEGWGCECAIPTKSFEIIPSIRPCVPYWRCLSLYVDSPGFPDFFVTLFTSS
ncbi:unnamed protein product [Dibothriocephalus latus]|uniref:GOLD domain-containing protein n=1 Tax=Dibothriocephalus latus TaxID=60516 RepID=A0A3P7LTT9_DIBLA|nr:unnamed protein product [Dibothriocephalus latus]